MLDTGRWPARGATGAPVSQAKQGRMWIYALVTALVIAPLWAHSTGAATITGTTGLLRVPTADSLPAGEWRLAAGYDGRGLLPSLSYGALPGLEIGVTTRADGELVPRVKFTVATESASAPGLAVGLEGTGWYAVASRRLNSPGLRAHVGVGSGRFGPVLVGVEARLRSVAVASADAQRSAPAVSLLVDYDGHAAAAGARLDFASGLTISAGVRAGDGLVGSAAYGIRF